MEDHTRKEALLLQAYTERLGSSIPTQMKFDLSTLIPPNVNLDHLTVPFTNEEIDLVIDEMPADHAPGPNGFSRVFLKAC